MHQIRTLFKKVIDELWEIKRHNSEIDFKELVEFWKEFKSHINLVDDAINAQIIAYDGLEMPFSEDDIFYMIEAFTTFNQNDYNRLLAEALFVLDHEQAYRYLSEMLNTDEKRLAFKKEFQRWSHFERVKEELQKLGNDL